MNKTEIIQAEFELWIAKRKGYKMENKNCADIEQKMLKMENEIRILANEMKDIHQLLKEMKPHLEARIKEGETVVKTEDGNYDLKILQEEIKALDKKLSEMFDSLNKNDEVLGKNDKTLQDTIMDTYKSLMKTLDRATGTIKDHTTQEIKKATQSINTTTAMEMNRW